MSQAKRKMVIWGPYRGVRVKEDYRQWAGHETTLEKEDVLDKKNNNILFSLYLVRIWLVGIEILFFKCFLFFAGLFYLHKNLSTWCHFWFANFVGRINRSHLFQTRSHSISESQKDFPSCECDSFFCGFYYFCLSISIH